MKMVLLPFAALPKANQIFAVLVKMQKGDVVLHQGDGLNAVSFTFTCFIRYR